MTPPALDLTARAVLLDMDGTWVDSARVVEQVWTEFALARGVDPADVLQFAHGRLTADTVAHFLPAGSDPHPVAASLDAEELERLEGIVEVPGAGRFLAALAGFPVAVVTSASVALATGRMQAAGITPPEVTVTADDVAVGKPSPEGYLRAAELLGVPIGDCVVLEDADAGVRAGLAAGAAVVVVGPHASEATAGLPRIRDFTGLTVTFEGSTVRLLGA
jgi:sugar-phosphatase